MKTIAIIVFLLFISSSSSSSSSTNPTLFINSALQGTLGWAHPSSFQTCKAKALDMYNSYASLWMSLLTFQKTNILSAFQSTYDMFVAEPRCYFATNIASRIFES